MKEAVLYIFIKNNHILIEHRLQGEKTILGIMIPGGGIESHDQVDGKDYREVALFREIGEELGNHIVIKEYHSLGSIIRTETGTPFHMFLVTAWEGDMPDYIIEDGIQDGKLEWMAIDDVQQQTTNQITLDALEHVKKYLENSV
jgi:8-oxo-dGTP pyrophosphatase MutT (NUDIX family)